jgi:hypothetical protein
MYRSLLGRPTISCMPTFAELLPSRFRGRGLSTAELDVAQEQAGASFPPDLCELLYETLPVGPKFPDWRDAQATMQSWRERLVATVHFDVLHNGFWLPEWESRPEHPEESREAVASHLAAAPAMIPIYAHRAIPNEPLAAGNPVFSIYQTDVVVYGRDLADYLVAEFDRNHHEALNERSDVRSIRFWTRMLDLGDSEYPNR